MLYFVNRTKYFKNGGYKSSEEMVYTDRQKAEAKFYSNIGSDMSDDTLSGSRCMVSASNGEYIKGKTWGTLIEETAEKTTAE